MRTVVTILSLALAGWADSTSLDSNGMSALNHARYPLDNCEEFTELKKSGVIEYDYIDQMLAGKTKHSPGVVARIKEIREQYKQIAKQLRTAKKYQYRHVYDRLKDPAYKDCEECDPPYTEETREITAYYYRDNLIKIEWLYATNSAFHITTSVFFDIYQRPIFGFHQRVDPSWYNHHTRFYYDERGQTIAVAYRGGWENDRCESKSVPSMDLLKNYPAPLDERENPIDEMDHLDEMICTAKKQPGCNYFRGSIR